MEGNCENSKVFSSEDSYHLFRPRGVLARAMYQKHQSDVYLMGYDKSKWYNCDLSQLPKHLAEKFVQLSPDEESIKFIERCEEKSDWIFTQIWQALARTFLSWFMTQTSINGWLQRGSMFVVSLSQFLRLIKSDENWHREFLIDLGAGDGKVTAHIAPLFDKVFVTEMSGTMRSLLSKKGYSILEIEDWDDGRKYDLIMCLNLIDRCNMPMQLLKRIRQALQPGGLVFLALVLPFSAYVEVGSKTHKPEELLPIIGSSFEAQVDSLVSDVLEPNGFKVESWSRVPYLCEGDLRQSYYWLDDAIFILKAEDSS